MAFLSTLLRNAFFSFLGHVLFRHFLENISKVKTFWMFSVFFFSTLPKLFQILKIDRNVINMIWLIYLEKCIVIPTQLQDAGCWSDAATLAATHLKGSDYARFILFLNNICFVHINYNFFNLCMGVKVTFMS